MITRDQIIDRAREYLGTPFKHQGRHIHRGVDCSGLCICVLRDLGITEFNITNYARLPDVGMFKANLRKVCGDPILLNEAKPADIAFMVELQRNGTPKWLHIGFLTDLKGELGLIHSYIRNRGVVEHRLDDTWRKRIIHVYKAPGVE